MKKLSKILLLVLMAFIAVPSFVLADELCSGCTAVTRKETSYGQFVFSVKKETLIDGDTYKWGISTSRGVDPTKYFDVLNPNLDNNLVDITIDATNDEILSVIRKTDNVYLTIINSTGDKIIDDIELDVKAPLIHAFEINKDEEWYGKTPSNPAYEISTYYDFNSENTFVLFEKITNAEVINEYVDGIDLNKLSLKGFDEAPKNGDSKWFQTSAYITGKGLLINNEKLPEEDGLYYLWVRGSNATTKPVYGYKVIEIGKVTKVEDKKEENKVTTTTKKNVTTTTKKVENTTNNKVTNTTQKKEENPKTADTNVLYILAAMLVFGAIGVIGNKKAKNN